MNSINLLITTTVLAAGTQSVMGQSPPDCKVVAPAMAATFDSKPDTGRYVADDLENVTLPNGEAVTRLISTNRITPRQYWVHSVYPQGAVVVFHGNGVTADNLTGSSGGQNSERQISQICR